MLRTIWGRPGSLPQDLFPADYDGNSILQATARRYDEAGISASWAESTRAERAGHRLGTMESNRSRTTRRSPKLPWWAAYDVTGEAIVAFVVLKGARPASADAQKIIKELQDWVAKESADREAARIRFGDHLPKPAPENHARLLRSIAKGEGIAQDVSTLENPAILEQLKEAPA